MIRRSFMLLGFSFCVACPAAVTPNKEKPPTTQTKIVVPPTTIAATKPAIIKPATTLAIAPASVPFEDPSKKWESFFKEHFGGLPSQSFFSDFNGDGKTDAAYRIEDSIFIFHDVTTTPPTEWSSIDADKDATVEVKTAAWAIEKLPELKGSINEKQSVFSVGDSAYPVLTFWYPTEATYAWLQVFTEKASILETSPVKASNKITKNNLYGEKGFYGEDPLIQPFVGDFDGDGDAELVVIENGPSSAKLWHFLPGATPTKPAIIEYSGTKMSLHPNKKPKAIEVNFDSESVKSGKFTIKSDYIESWLPEKSSVYLVYDKKKWKVLWMGD
jgi:hypothetical protein